MHVFYWIKAGTNSDEEKDHVMGRKGFSCMLSRGARIEAFYFL
jgi:hypothetical protein